MKIIKSGQLLLLVSLTITLSGCNGIGTAEIDGSGSISSDPSSLTFAGVTSVDRKTDITLKLNWTAHPNAVAYEIYNTTSGTPVWIRTVTGQASSSTIITGLTASTAYKFRVRAKDAAGQNDSNTNDFSLTTNATPVCPANYLLVRHNDDLGVQNDFCVMKYEAKFLAGAAVSQPGTSPWVLINLTDAKTECTDLGTGYDLISNSQWMTIAREVENIDENWTDENVGDGMLFRGHTDNDPANTLDVILSTDGYDGTNNDVTQTAGGIEQRRTLELASGEEIWDFTGNVWEWNDWTTGGALDFAPVCPSGGWKELFEIDCDDFSSADMRPGNPADIAPLAYNTADYGLGQYFGDVNNTPLRSGSFNAGNFAGIFSLAFFADITWTGNDVGFRCVYSP